MQRKHEQITGKTGEQKENREPGRMDEGEETREEYQDMTETDIFT